MIESLFSQLLQVAIGTRQSLSVSPSAKQWAELFALSKKQALVGVAFHGLSLLKNRNSGEDDFGSSFGINEKTYLKWLGLSAKIQQRNKVMNSECVRVTELLQHDGFHCCILKGQGNLVYYPEGLRECRTPGDIDVLFRSMEEPGVLDLPVRYCQNRARLLQKKVPHVTYHHADLAWEGHTEVEGHYRATFLCSPVRNLRLQHWLEENMPWGVSDAKIGESTFPIPTVSYNAVYQLLHIYKHLFEEGIGLRQLLDYYFVLRALHIEQGTLSGSPLKGEEPDHWQAMAQWAKGMGIAVASNKEIMHTLSRFGMKKFAGATMYVLQTVFAMPDEYLICQPNEKEGKFLLNEIMQAGNFGKYDDRIKHGGTQLSHAIEKTKHNLRLLTHYPEEVICEPFFRLNHWIWRKLELWRW